MEKKDTKRERKNKIKGEKDEGQREERMEGGERRKMREYLRKGEKRKVGE